jgi:xanthine dehydrogenase accessory factor
VRRRTATLVIAGASELADATATIAITLGWIVRCSADADTACHHLDQCTDGDALIVMSHDPSLDEPVLVRAATTPLGYIGVLGSRRIHTQRHARLRRRGLDDTFIARLRGPAGLDIGAWTPQETAISLMAEVIALRGGRTGRPLTDIPDRIHH